MTTIIETVNRVSMPWAGLMAAVLWQSTVVILVVAVVALLLRRASPRIRYWLWQIVAIKMLLMPFWVLAVPLPFFALPTSPPVQPEPRMPDFPPQKFEAPVRPTMPSGPKPAVEPLPPPAAPSLISTVSWSTWLFLLWAVVVLWKVVSVSRQRYALGRLMRLTTPADGKLTGRVHELSQQLGIRREPRTLLVDHPGLLFVCGLWSPKLILPRSLPTSLPMNDIDPVLLHELAHLRRGDLYWGWTIELARIIYFFHPLVYWVGYRLHLERELACDQVAMAVSGHAPGDYAETLVRVVSHASEIAKTGNSTAK